MELQIHPIEQSDLPAILTLNELAVPQVNSLPLEKMAWLVKTAVYARKAELAGQLAGFLLGLDEQAAYDSHYFGWFRERYPRFIYVDRVIVADWARRRGVGLALYRDIEDFCRRSSRPLTADVYSLPPNDISLAFHDRFGFTRVGLQPVENGTKQAAKFLKIP